MKPEQISGNVFQLIGNEWMLITAGTMDRWNTMTASWGGLGVLWSKNVSFCFVRDSRYTYEFMNEASTYSLSFYPPAYKDALKYCGSHSGRDVDKAAETGLVPVELEGTVAFQQARLVLVCTKIYQQDIDPANFIDPGIEASYPNKDYHRVYVGEIRTVYSAPDAS